MPDHRHSPYQTPTADVATMSGGNPANGRWGRLLLGAVLPPVSGTVLLAGISLTGNSISATLGFFITGLPIAFAMVGLQSLVCSVAMEWLVNPRIRRDWLVIAVSIGLGALSGAVIALGNPAAAIFPTAIGFFSGLVTGWVLRRNYRRNVLATGA